MFLPDDIWDLFVRPDPVFKGVIGIFVTVIVWLVVLLTLPMAAVCSWLWTWLSERFG